jgi:arylsulfatase A-like enzyme
MSRHRNRGFQAFETPWSKTYPGVLRASGYFTGQIGKWHNGAFPKEQFDFGRAYGGRFWMPQAAGERVHVTMKNEQDALEFLHTAPSDQPFCLTLAFFATHAEDGHPEQFLPQSSSADLYANAEIPQPAASSAEHLSRLPAFLRDERNEGRVRWHWRFDDEAKRMEMMRRYYRLATEVDSACGRILSALRETQRLDQTLVVFTTDNGYFHGEHGLADKWYPYEESIRVPCIVRDPRLPPEQRGQVIEEMTLSVDIAPTLLQAAGAKVPSGMQGVDLAPLYLAKERPAWREEFYYEHPIIDRKERIPSSEALVRRDLKYIYWPDYEYEELFDLRLDPNETQNLASDPSRAAELIDLRQRLAQLRDRAR